MRMLSRTCLLSSALLAASSLLAQSPLLLVANQTDHTLSLIDPATNHQVAAIDVKGITGHEVAVSPDGRTAYVPIYGDSGVGKPGTDGQVIDVIDLPSRSIRSTIDFGHGVRPHMPAYDSATNQLLVTTELDRSIAVIDPATLKVQGSIPTGQEQSHMFVFSPDQKRIYTANVGPGTVSVLDVASRKVLAIIPISSKTQRIAISPDGRSVFTSDQAQPRLAVIDTATNAVRAWVALPDLGYGSAITQDGRTLLIVHRATSQLSVVDLKTLQVERTLAVPNDPTEVIVRPDGRFAYVSCGKAGQVAVVDLASWSVVARIDAGRGADGLAWAR
ncbi:MAG: hypothetical protein KGK08_06690 [Acidobacteriota bacterium]|nr:hypothetical protein [Acidobacteriota bacterium]